MKKVRFLQFLFIVIMFLAFILLTGEIFGQMRPMLVSVLCVAMWVAVVANAACAIVLLFGGKKKKKELEPKE